MKALSPTLLMLPVGGHREPTAIEHLLPHRQDPQALWRRPLDLIRDGAAVLAFSTQRIPLAVEKLLEYAHVSKSQGYFIHRMDMYAGQLQASSTYPFHVSS